MNNFNLIPRLVDYSSDEEQFDECEIKSVIEETSLHHNSSWKTSSEHSIRNQNKCDTLPLPSEIKHMYLDTKENVIDDPEKHGGKIRSFPHERGVWATYIYIEYEALPEFLEMIHDLKNMTEQHGIILNPVDDFHVSLSRTLKLRHHWIQSFVDSLKVNLRNFLKFKIMFQSLEVYENEEKTRTFVGLKAHFGYDYLCKITKKVDACLSEFKLPFFYENPSFHMSCISCVGSKAKEIERFMADLNGVFHSFAESYPASRTLWVKNIYCKSGNKLFVIPLKS